MFYSQVMKIIDMVILLVFMLFYSEVMKILDMVIVSNGNTLK
jgi:hypothetical protein